MFYIYIIVYFSYNFISTTSQAVDIRPNIEVTANEGSILHVDFHNLGTNRYETCGYTGQCENQGKKKLDLLCMIVNETQGDTHRQYIKAKSERNVSAEYSGNWNCDFALQYSTENGQKTVEIKKYTVTFFIVPLIKEVEEMGASKWIYIGSGIGIFAFVIIITQTICILYFKRKARRRQRIQSLQSSTSLGSHDNAERYIKMPGQIKMELLSKESRDSAIYEALENIPISKPEPPPIDTLPRPGNTSSESQQTSLSRKPLPPPTAKKPKNKNIDKHNEDTMRVSSLERIKHRKPQPLPTDDPAMYEVMTPPDYVKKPESGLSRVLPGKAQLPMQAVPVFPAGNNLKVLPSMIVAAQLKAVNKSNNTIAPSNKSKHQTNPKPKKTAPVLLNAIKNTQPVPPVFRKPPAPLPIQPIPANKGSISSDDEEWTYEPLTQYNQYNIYDNVSL